MYSVLLSLVLVQLVRGAFDPELNAKYLQLPRDQFIQYFNSQNYTWKIKHYPHLENKSFTGAKLINPPPGVGQIHHDPQMFANLPEYFDAREHWPNCVTIKDIYNQGDCGSCWTFAVGTVASDRTCIHKGLIVRLSEQDFNNMYNICFGGVPYLAFMFWIESGLVTQKCKPYNITESNQGLFKKECKDPSINYLDDKHRGEWIYTVPNEDDVIKAELIKNGPIQAGFTVYADFVNYTSGIYEHQYGGKRSGHAVKIIGYGAENGVDYWLAANSWGTEWGEKGYFRIKRHQPELEFEKWLLGGIPKN